MTDDEIERWMACFVPLREDAALWAEIRRRVSGHARLVAALREIADISPEPHPAASIARAALAGSGGTKEHEPSCPRAQFWDAGEWQAPCTCKPGACAGGREEAP